MVRLLDWTELLKTSYFPNDVVSFAVLDSGRLTGSNCERNMQDVLLSLIPFMTYSLCPFITALFLLDPSDSQFAFSLLPNDHGVSMVVKLLVAACEFYIVMMWMATAHFGAYHILTFLKAAETTHRNAIEQVK